MPAITRIYGPLTEAEWRASMVNEVVYIKPVSENGERAFSIHAADGTELAIIGTRDSALAAVLGQNLEAVSVHQRAHREPDAHEPFAAQHRDFVGEHRAITEAAPAHNTDLEVRLLVQHISKTAELVSSPQTKPERSVSTA